MYPPATLSSVVGEGRERVGMEKEALVCQDGHLTVVTDMWGGVFFLLFSSFVLGLEKTGPPAPPCLT